MSYRSQIIANLTKYFVQGDSLSVECYYDTKDRDATTFVSISLELSEYDTFLYCAFKWRQGSAIIKIHIMTIKRFLRQMTNSSIMII